MGKRIYQKHCLFCGEHFETTVKSQIYCSSKCSAAGWTSRYCQSRPRPAPEKVRIRLPKRIPVYPEFQLEPGRVYEAEKFQSCQSYHVTYIVTLDEKHRTIVRPDECEEVADE